MTWTEANRQFLIAAAAAVREMLNGNDETRNAAQEAMETACAGLGGPAAIDTLAGIFELSEFERWLLLLAAGVEIDSGLAALRPTLGLAMTKLPNPHWTALTSSGVLRYWRMISVEDRESLLTAPVRIDERILHYLAGAPAVDERLRGYVEPIDLSAPLSSEQVRVAERIHESWRERSRPQPVVLCGSDPLTRRAIAAHAVELNGLAIWALDADLLPAAPADFENLLTAWDREAALSNSVLLLECDRASNENAVVRWIERTRNELIVSSDVRRLSHLRPALTLDIPAPGWADQWALWQSEEGPRVAARPKLQHLAQRIEPTAHWEDLVLPKPQLETLREIAMHVRQRAKVYDEWGFAAKSARGLGIGALFSGPSGTGKTMAAEVLANDLNLDLYRVDLSQVVSKYIGETEKNLRKVFDAAEEGGAILLFDEADALFGKRSEVKDSHDRYANVEISYLLQRMEAYRGLAILTTNMKSAMDQAFQRRIRFFVEFPFPDAASRNEIWRRIFPSATPVNGIDTAVLARMNIAGGNIRNIALSAAFRAADAGEPVRMSHVLEAARAEYLKMERPLGEIDMGALK